MIYYSLFTLMLAGIRDILIITTPQDAEQFQRLLGDGSRFGVNLTYTQQPSPDGLAQAFILGKEHIGDGPVAFVLGDNIFYGQGLGTQLGRFGEINGGAVFGYWVAEPSAYGVVEFDSNGKAVSLEEKPAKPKSHYAVPGLYFYDNDVVQIARDLKPSARGGLEITDVNRVYLGRGSSRWRYSPAGLHGWIQEPSTTCMTPRNLSGRFNTAKDYPSDARKKSPGGWASCLIMSSGSGPSPSPKAAMGATCSNSSQWAQTLPCRGGNSCSASLPSPT